MHFTGNDNFVNDQYLKLTQLFIWAQIYQPFSGLLVKLTNCENLYTQLSFLKPKWYYMRKDPASIIPFIIIC